ncbi:hypothetical protein, partial [Roseibacillus persicicus]|uniref:hypothetical protein n=1 Tax=Roseibacillus persicicus TaxID=454148 RepID=UPI001E614E07
TLGRMNRKLVDVVVPEDLRLWLTENPGKVFEFDSELESGDDVVLQLVKVRLVAIDRLKCVEIPIDNRDFYNMHPDLCESNDFGPDEDKDALYYKFRAVDIIDEDLDDQFHPVGLFSWYPDLLRYGTWDETHQIIYTFPNVTWTDITERPHRYFNGQWSNLEEGEKEPLMPWVKQRFHKDLGEFELTFTEYTQFMDSWLNSESEEA